MLFYILTLIYFSNIFFSLQTKHCTGNCKFNVIQLTYASIHYFSNSQHIPCKLPFLGKQDVLLKILHLCRYLSQTLLPLLSCRHLPPVGPPTSPSSTFLHCLVIFLPATLSSRLSSLLLLAVFPCPPNLLNVPSPPYPLIPPSLSSPSPPTLSLPPWFFQALSLLFS